ncbi:TPA: hypothetical protein ACH3X2_001261 [Trebouxia sp. C0005]
MLKPAIEYADIGCISVIFLNCVNSVGYIVGISKINSPAYMYSAVACTILAWHLHLGGMYMYYIVQHAYIMQMLHLGSTCRSLRLLCTIASLIKLTAQMSQN